MSQIRKGTIAGIEWERGSGLAMVGIDEETTGGTSRRVAIPCDAGPTFRALRSAFGDEVAGQEVLFTVDNLGVLEGFSPVEEV